VEKKFHQRLTCNENLLEETAHTPLFLQNSGSEYQLSSTTGLGFLGLSVNATAAIEEVKTTRLSVGEFTHDFRTLRVPFTAGSNNSV